MTMMSFKSLFQLPKRQPKPWLVAVTLSALLAAGLVVASQDLAQLQAERGDIVHQVAVQSANLTEAKNANAELGKQISTARDTIAAQEKTLSATTGLLP